MSTFFEHQLHLGAHNLESALVGIDGSVERVRQLEPLVAGHGQIDMQLMRLKRNASRVLVHFFGKDGDNDVSVRLVKVVAALHQLPMFLWLGLAYKQVLVFGAAGDLEELVEFEHAPLAARVAL